MDFPNYIGDTFLRVCVYNLGMLCMQACLYMFMCVNVDVHVCMEVRGQFTLSVCCLPLHVSG